MEADSHENLVGRIEDDPIARKLPTRATFIPLRDTDLRNSLLMNSRSSTRSMIGSSIFAGGSKRSFMWSIFRRFCILKSCMTHWTQIANWWKLTRSTRRIATGWQPRWSIVCRDCYTAHTINGFPGLSWSRRSKSVGSGASSWMSILKFLTASTCLPEVIVLFWSAAVGGKNSSGRNRSSFPSSNVCSWRFA